MTPTRRAAKERSTETGSAADFLPPRLSLPALRRAAAGCRGCHLWRVGTQTVFGAGARTAQVMFVGEQPGGFGVKTGIGINPEARGRMPTRSWYTRRYKEAFRGGFTVLSAIGQGATTVTVLQLALAYAALANGGTLYQPQVVRSIETSDGTVVQDFPPRVRRLIEPNQEHLAWVKSALEGVVNEKEGTAYKERMAGVDIAGKTGTAQVSHVTPRGVDPGKIWYFNRDHAWFSGYAPSRSPEIAIVVLVEHGGGGGKNAGPVAMRVVRDWQKLKEKHLSAKDDASASGAGSKPN